MKRVIRWAELSFRLHRLEIFLLTAGVLAVSGLMAWFALQLHGISEAHLGCDFAEAVPSCQAAAQRFESIRDVGQLVMSSTSLVTFAVGLFLGVPLVAREVEQGTAQFAWTMTGSRLRWVIRRGAFPTLLAIVLLGLLAFMSDVLAQAMRPDIDTSQAFWFYGGRGPLLIGRGMLAFGVGLLVGSVLGRQLPAMLLAAFAAAGLVLVSEVPLRTWHETEAVVATSGEYPGEPLGLGSGVVLPTGERVPYSEVGAEFQDETGAFYATEADFQARRNPIGTEYLLIVPGERYPEIVARETVAFTFAGLLLTGGAAALVVRRRPS